jgi:hypothetical protein
MSSQTLFTTQGTDFSTNIQLLADDGTAINIASYIFAGQLKKNPYSANVYPLTLTPASNANGNLTMALPAATSANMSPGAYDYIVTYYTANTTEVLVEGEFNILPNPLIIQPPPTTYANGNVSEFIATANNTTANVP